jgi:Major Facilitator Superfamily
MVADPLSLLRPPAHQHAALRALIVLSISQIIAWGTLFYGMTMLGTRIRAETGWSSTLVYGGFAFAMLVSGLAAPKVGAAIDARGGRGVMAAGSLVGASGYAVLAVSYHPLVYVFGWLLIGLGMAASLYDPAFATLARYAGTRSRRAISTLTLAGGLASTVFWPVGLWLLGFLDWRMVALIYAALNGVVCAALHRFGLPPDSQRAALNAPVAVPSNDNHDASASAPAHLRNTILICLTLSTMFHGLITNAMSVHLIAALDGMGLTETQAVAAGALIGPSQTLARLVELMLGGRYPVILVGLISTGLMPAAFGMLFAGAFGLTAVTVFAVLYGASNGLLTIARGVIPLTLLGREGYGKTLGKIAGPTLAAKSSAPLLFAVCAAAFGTTTTLSIMAGLSVVSFSAMLWLALALRRS